MEWRSTKEKLEAYRHKKYKEKMKESIRSSVRKMFWWNRDDGNKKSVGESAKEEEIKLYEETRESENIQDVENAWSEDSAQESKNMVIKKVTYLLYFLLWVILYAIALEYEFGAVYFILSAFIFIWLNTRSRPKQQGELSAYSVFNPNCEAIEGTLDASQFEKEIRYGIGGVR